MPTLYKGCHAYGCPQRVPMGTTYCPTHAAADRERRREYDRMRYRRDPQRRLVTSGVWKRVRAAFLAEHPVCAEPRCGEAATDVDHRDGLARGADPFDWRGLTPFCHRHHSSKSARSGERWPR